mmetsp:Transcript_11645/g.17672  ORF Transcript_11645/g.17672 Transcript_11645/m.17672 type:complete len:184 (+) Transcript_11645:1-552(+)
MKQDEDSLLKSYWSNRLKAPRTFTLFINTIYFLSKFMGIFVARNSTFFKLNLMYTIVSGVVYLLLLPSLWNRKYDFMVRFGFMIFGIRSLLFAYVNELVGQRENINEKTWILQSILIIFCAILLLSFHMHNFDRNLRGHTAFTVVFVGLIFSTVYCAVYGLRIISMSEISANAILSLVIILPI